MRLVLAALVFACAGLGQLADVLARYKVPAPPDGLDRGVTRYGVLDEPASFHLFFHSGSDQRLNAWRYDKREGGWLQRTFETPRRGSIINVTGSRHFLFVKTHLTPSAGDTLVFTRDLEYREALSGWPLAVFGEDQLVWQHSMVHFAPVHAAEVSIYDPRSGEQRQIYPLKPYPPIRRAHMEKIAAARKLDYEWFTNHVWGDVVVNNRTRSLAFEIAFDNKEYLSERDKLRIEVFRDYRRRGGGGPSRELLMAIGSDLRRLRRMDREREALELFEGKVRVVAEALAERNVDVDVAPEVWRQFVDLANGPAEFTRAVYIFRNLSADEPVNYREAPFADVGRLCGSDALAACLEPEALARIFR